MDMMLGAKQGAGAAQAVKDVTTATFEAEVILASRDVPIIVDFWATWCGPCKQLTPALEKAVAATKGRVRMVKVDVDRNPELSQALRIQSIPTVYAFYQGRPLDGFMGALPESQIKAFIDRILQAAGGAGGEGDEIQLALEDAKAALESGDAVTAQDIYSQILEIEPANPQAVAGLARVYILGGDLDRAREVLARPTEPANAPEIAAVRSAIELAEQAAKAGPIGQLEAAVAKDPADQQARFDLALALHAAGRVSDAIDALVEIVRRDRTWNEEAARKQLVKIFEALGPTDPLTVAGRRRLSTVLFS